MLIPVTLSLTWAPVPKSDHPRLGSLALLRLKSFRVTIIIPASMARPIIPATTPTIVFFVLEPNPEELFTGEELLVGSDGTLVISVEDETEVTTLPETVTTEVMSSIVVEGSKVVVRVIGLGVSVVICFVVVEDDSVLCFDELVEVIAGVEVGGDSV